MAIFAKKSLSRAAAKGILAPDMMVPLSVTRMLSGHGDGDERRAPPPVTTAMAVTAGRGEAAICAAGRMYWIAAFVAMYEHADDEEAGDERDGQAALGVADFAGDHGEVVPAVVGPECGDEGDHESAEAACAPGKNVWKLQHAARRRREAEAGDDQDERAFEPGEDELEVAGFADAEIVEPGDDPSGGDGEDLRPDQRQD